MDLTNNYPSRLSKDSPSLSVSEKMCIAQQLEKWLKTGIVLSDENYSKRNDVTLQMLFGVPKPDGSTRPILNRSDEMKLDHSPNNLIDPKLCTVKHAQTKQVVETVLTLGKNAWLWAQDLKGGYHDASVNENDVHELGFIFDDEIYIFQCLLVGLSTSPNIFTEFMHLPVWAMKQDRPDLHYKEVDEFLINIYNFTKGADVISCFKITDIQISIYYNHKQL